MSLGPRNMGSALYCNIYLSTERILQNSRHNNNSATFPLFQSHFALKYIHIPFKVLCFLIFGTLCNCVINERKLLFLHSWIAFEIKFNHIESHFVCEHPIHRMNYSLTICRICECERKIPIAYYDAML